MIEKGLKANDIASRLGVPEAKVSRWLSGNHDIDIDTLYQITDALEEPLHISVGVMAPAPAAA
jgi:transcriptional regulator with XRE-family HTH domain